MFTDEEFKMLLNKDLDAVRDVLGEKSFLFGDRPTTVCFLSQKANIQISAGLYRLRPPGHRLLSAVSDLRQGDHPHQVPHPGTIYGPIYQRSLPQ